VLVQVGSTGTAVETTCCDQLGVDDDRLLHGRGYRAVSVGCIPGRSARRPVGGLLLVAKR
jgi:hypothetical protein